jgi:hypothetical protein
VIAHFLQVLAVITLVVVAAVALGNEIRLVIDDRDEEQAFRYVARHYRATSEFSREWDLSVKRAVSRAVNRVITVVLFAEADEAFAASAPTELITRSTA